VKTEKKVGELRGDIGAVGYVMTFFQKTAPKMNRSAREMHLEIPLLTWGFEIFKFSESELLTNM
jgi:hypothetical protein